MNHKPLFILFTWVSLLQTTGLISQNSAGLYPIIKDDKYGYINSEGKIVMQPKYDYAEDFNSAGTAIVFLQRKYFLINKKGERVSEYFQLMEQRKNVIQTYNDGELSDFMGHNSVSGGKKGFIDLSGKVVIENGKFDEIGWQGMLGFEYWDYEEFKVRGKQGVVDCRGKIVIEPIYDDVEIGQFQTLRFAKVKSGNRYGIIDFDGNVRVPVSYSEIVSPDKMGIAFATNEKGTVMLNRNGEIIKKFPSNIFGACRDGSCMLYDKNLEKIALCDTNGKTITEFKFGKIYSFNSEEIAPFIDSKLNQVGFINRQGDIIIPPTYEKEKYSSHLPNEGLICVRKNGKFGFIDYTGKVVIDFKFEKASDFEKGYSVIKLNGQFGLIGKDGSFVIPADHDSLEYDSFYSICKLIAGKNPSTRKFGAFSIKNRKRIVDPKFDEIEILDNGYVRGKYMISDSPPVIQRYGLYNTEGQEVMPPIYNDIEVVDNLIRVVFRQEGTIRDKQINYINGKGVWIY
jgi:hypothetical protein